MNNESLDPLYAAIFTDPENGTPDSITQAGCLALARLGRKAWNTWRSKYPSQVDAFWVSNAVDFSGVDFRNEHMNFDSFIFGHGASFKNAQFGQANFVGAEFGERANFIGAKLGYCPSFYNARFGYGASFSGAQFIEGAIFTSVEFGDHVCFYGAQFGDGPNINQARFGNGASFVGTQFGYGTNFEFTKFGESVTFIGCSWASLTSQYRRCSDDLEAIKAWAEERGLNPETFKSISFAGTNFTDRVDFSGRMFEGHTSFGCINAHWPTKFGKAPLFHNCKLHQDTTFDGAIFPEPSSDPIENDIAARAYRTLKLAFSQHQATHDEQRFFRLEMAEEAQRTSHYAPRLLFRLYSFFSDYGFSVSRPFVWLWLIPLLTTVPLYSWLANFTPCFPWRNECQIRYDLLQFVFIQALPLPGLDKWGDSLQRVLFPTASGDWQGIMLIGILLLHKALSLLAVFLIGLALRNLFKMK